MGMCMYWWVYFAGEESEASAKGLGEKHRELYCYVGGWTGELQRFVCRNHCMHVMEVFPSKKIITREMAW